MMDLPLPRSRIRRLARVLVFASGPPMDRMLFQPSIDLLKSVTRRQILVVLVGLALGMIVAEAPGEFALLAGLALVVTALIANIGAGLLLVCLLLLIQFPVQSLLEPFPEFDLALRYSDDVLIALLALAVVWHARNDLRRNRLVAVVVVALAASLSLGLAGALIHGSPPKVIVLDAFSLSKWCLVLAAAFQLRMTAESMLRLLRIATLAAIALAVFGYVDLFFPSLTHEILPIAGPVAYRMGFRCLVSIFPNEGVSGWFFAAMACLPAAGYLVLRRPIDLSLTVFLLVTSFLSYRRKPVLGMALALGVLLVCRTPIRHRRRILAAAALTAVVILPLLGTAMLDIFVQAWDLYIAPAEPMQIARNAMYIASWQIGWDEFPIGAGLGLFGGYASTIEYSPYYVRYGLDRVWGLAPSASSPSNPNFVTDVFFPHLLGALGLVGASLYLFALLHPGWKLVRASRRGMGSATQVAVIAALLVFFEALTESVAAPIYEVSFPSFLVFGLVGAALSCSAEPAAEPSSGHDGGGDDPAKAVPDRSG